MPSRIPAFGPALALFALLLGLPARADAPVALPGLIDLALKSSPVLQKAEAEREEGAWRQWEGGAALLPVVTLNAGHIFEKRFQYLNIPFGGGPIVEFPQIFPTTSGTLSARWTLFDGLANVRLFQSGAHQKKGAELQYEWSRFQLEQEVMLAYYRYLSAKKLEEVAQSNLKTLENHLAQIRNLKEGGLATNYDVLKVETQTNEAQAELLQAEDNSVIARDRLVAVVGGGSVEIAEGSLPSPEPGLVEKVRALGARSDWTQRRDLQALREQVQAADRLDSAASMFWAPRISLGADYIKYNNLTDSLSDWNRYRNAWNVGVFLSWTLFGVKDFAQARQNHYKALSVEKSARSAQLQAPVDFAFWKKRFLYSAALFKAKTADLVRATETVRLAEAGFKAGVRTTLEVLDAELELFRARAGIVNAQMNGVEARIQLELAQGERI